MNVFENLAGDFRSTMMNEFGDFRHAASLTEPPAVDKRERRFPAPIAMVRSAGRPPGLAARRRCARVSRKP